MEPEMKKKTTNVSFILHTYKLASVENLERVNFGLRISYKRRIYV